jgi:hypothetical protein
MTTSCILARLDAKSGNPNGHIGSMRVTATNQHPQDLRACLEYVTWPGFWQLASKSPLSVLHGLFSAVGYKFHALNHFLNCHGLP